MKKRLCWLCVTGCAVVILGYLILYAPRHAPARGYIHVLSSKRAFVYGTAVAEQFAKYANFKVPLVESKGLEDQLFSSFCAGVGLEYPDILLPARRMTAEELVACRANKVVHITELSFGTMTFGQPHFLYVKVAHIPRVPSIRSYVREFMSQDASGSNGYLAGLGLIPLAREQHAAEAQRAVTLPVLTADDLNPH